MELSTAFDSIFRRYGGRLPVAFLRALSKRESNLNPSEANDPAWGLMQVVPVVRTGYNDRFGTSYTKQDLLDPNVNVKIASELLNRIISQYGKHRDRNLHENWTNPEFVKLVVAGWNSGYSEAGGVGKVAKYLEDRGIPVTHDSVFAYSGAAGATEHLRNPTKKSWQRSVADLFFSQRDRPMLSRGQQLLVVGIIGLGAWALYQHLR